MNFPFCLSLITCMVIGGLSGCNHPDALPPDPIDLKAVDSTVRPQDDFYLYANGTWLKKAVIPTAESEEGSFNSLIDTALFQMRRILDSTSRQPNLVNGSIEQQVADLYNSFMDSTSIETKGSAPVKGYLMRIDSVKDVPGFLGEVAKEYTEGNGELFNFYGGADYKNSNWDMARFDQGGLGLPNRDYYFKKDSSVVKVKQAYQDYVAKVFTLSGESADQAKKDATNVLNVETSLASVSKNETDLRDPIANYHKLTLAEFEQLTPGMHWRDLLGKLQVHSDTVIIGQPAFYTGMYHALRHGPLSSWKSYLKFHVIDAYAGVMSTDFVNAQFAFSSQLSGRKELQPRWKRACQLVDNNLGDALGQLYVKIYFPPQAKQRMNDLVDSLLVSFADHIQAIDWMSDSTKVKALAKLKQFTKKIGYPDKWKDYSTITINRGNVVDNLVQCQEYEYHRNVHKIGKTVDRTDWYMTPPTINAYYNPTVNDITFPAGILQPPFFFKDGDDAVNYGAIGYVIGHEMTHGFDDQGRLFDGDGNLKNWWSAEDSARFVQKANLVVRQYDNYLAIDTFHVNGNLTLGENIADIGGLAIAYSAFKKTAQGKDTTRIDGLTPDERFFMSFNQVWRAKVRPESARTGIMVDPHSPYQFRINGPLSNLNAFYTTYHVKPSDKMYLVDSLKARIW